tara:strand:+ start:623 stop:1189 length:567 start_codon:yes stop_codon:yes gene_type:complete
MTEQELLELFGEEFRDIMTSIDAGMPVAMESLMVSIFGKVQMDTVVFGARITQHVESLLDAGMTLDFIEGNLADDMAASGRIFGELKNSIIAGIQEMTNQAGRLGQLEIYGEKYKEYRWITVAGHKICPDCAARGGQVASFEQWENEGLPGSGWSVCRGRCYCVLDPTGTVSKEVNAPADIKEKNFST